MNPVRLAPQVLTWKLSTTFARIAGYMRFTRYLPEYELDGNAGRFLYSWSSRPASLAAIFKKDAAIIH